MPVHQLVSQDMGAIPDPPSLLPVYYKMYRAGTHLKELQSELQGYFHDDPGQLVAEPQTAADSITATFQMKSRMPARLPIIAGDCLQNMRSALDYLVWELVRAEGEEPGKHNMFPICPTEDAFKDALKSRGKRSGNLAGVNEDAVAMIDRLQPYRLGEDWEQSIIFTLNELTNINKHRRILLTDLKATIADLKVFNINGQIWGYGTLPVADDDAKFGPFAVTGQTVNVDSTLTAFVTFNETKAKGREIASALDGIICYLMEEIASFKGFFS
jgi:hypothetical protein